jgi:hypothetical protein
MQILALIALIVGSFLYHSEMGWPTVGTYWGIFGGAWLLDLFLPGFVVLVVQCFTVAIFFAHVKVKDAGLG